jgi:lysophospholipase L1-like esterase
MKRRILALLAAAALALGLGAAVPTAAAAESNAAYVAIGDSIASGNGLMPYTDPTCLRSNKAYPSLLAAALEVDVVSRACTSHTTTQVAAQASTLAVQGILGPDTELVTISAGVNDLPWLQVIGACSNLGSLQQCMGVMAFVPLAVQQSAYGVMNTLLTVRAAAPDARVVVTGYPELFGDFTGTCSVGVFDGTPMKFEAAQAQLLNDAVGYLNDAIQAGIALYQQQYMAMSGGFPDPNVMYVDVVDAFDTHGLCDSGERWISGLIAGKPLDRGFHPNVAGQQAYANEIWEALAL